MNSTWKEFQKNCRRKRFSAFLQMAAGLFLAVTGGANCIGLLGSLFDAAPADTGFLGNTLGSLAICALGVWLIRRALFKYRLVRRFLPYVTALEHYPSGSLTDIAASFGTSEDACRRDIELFIKKKLFTHVAIDKQTNCLTAGTGTAAKAAKPSAPVPTPAPKTESKPAPSTPKLPERISIRCPGCGAINVIPLGGKGECEYCGSQIEGILPRPVKAGRRA